MKSKLLSVEGVGLLTALAANSPRTSVLEFAKSLSNGVSNDA